MAASPVMPPAAAAGRQRVAGLRQAGAAGEGDGPGRPEGVARPVRALAPLTATAPALVRASDVSVMAAVPPVPAPPSALRGVTRLGEGCRPHQGDGARAGKTIPGR